MIKKLLAATAAAMMLAGCAGLGALGALGGAVSGGPQQLAERATLDERLAIGAETSYAFAAELGRTAFRTGLVPPTQSEAAQGADFCQQVVAGRVDQAALDRGGRIMALDCRAYALLLQIRTAYEAGNAASYQQAYDQAQPLLRDMLQLIRGR